MRIKLRLSGNDIDRILKAFDKNGDGTIDMQEFLGTMERSGSKRNVMRKALTQRAGIRKAFRRFDKDGDGVIAGDEFRKVVEAKYQTKLTDSEVDKLMDKADCNHDGAIDYEEFTKAFTYIQVRK